MLHDSSLQKFTIDIDIAAGPCTTARLNISSLSRAPQFGVDPAVVDRPSRQSAGDERPAEATVRDDDAGKR